MKKKIFLGMGICLMGFMMACDDSSSASSENNTTPAADTPATQNDVFTLKDSFKYTVTESDADQACSYELDITDAEFKFGPGSAVSLTTKDVEGSESYSGVYTKETDEDGDMYYILQLNVEGNVVNSYYEPGDEGIFIFGNNMIRIAAVHASEDVDVLLNMCGHWTEMF